MNAHPNQSAIDAELAARCERARAVMEPEDAARADMRQVIGDLRKVHDALERGNRHWAQARVEAMLRRLEEPHV